MSTKAIVIMGPSCAGKSTTANTLIQQLNTSTQSWKILEVDDIEDDWRAKQTKYTFDDLIDAGIETANKTLAAGTNVIVVTNIYRSILRNIKANVIKLILIAPSHEALQERFEKRKKDYIVQSLIKTATQLKREFDWIEESFKDFEQLSDFDLRIDASALLNNNVQQIISSLLIL